MKSFERSRIINSSKTALAERKMELILLTKEEILATVIIVVVEIGSTVVREQRAIPTMIVEAVLKMKVLITLETRPGEIVGKTIEKLHPGMSIA